MAQTPLVNTRPLSMLQYNKSIGTSRYGNPSLPDWVQGFVDNAKIEEAMENPEAPHWQKGVSIAENVYRILTDVYFQSYETFSSTYLTHDKKNLTPTEYLSLEMIHNNIHVGSSLVFILDYASQRNLTLSPGLDRRLGRGARHQSHRRPRHRGTHGRCPGGLI